MVNNGTVQIGQNDVNEVTPVLRLELAVSTTHAVETMRISVGGVTKFKINERAVLDIGRIKTSVLFTNDSGGGTDKLLALDVAQISNSTTRTWTAGNYSGYVAVPPDEGTSGNVLTSTGAASQPTYQSLSGAGIAPSNAQYVTLALSARLERGTRANRHREPNHDHGRRSQHHRDVERAPEPAHVGRVPGLDARPRSCGAYEPATLALDVTGRTAFVSVAQSISASQTNYDIGASTVLRITASNPALSIRGFTNGVDGRVVFLINDGATNTFFSRMTPRQPRPTVILLQIIRPW